VREELRGFPALCADPGRWKPQPKFLATFDNAFRFLGDHVDAFHRQAVSKEAAPAEIVARLFRRIDEKIVNICIDPGSASMNSLEI
jgi:hypothetical protein